MNKFIFMFFVGFVLYLKGNKDLSPAPDSQKGIQILQE